jgi:guanylate cyclase
VVDGDRPQASIARSVSQGFSRLLALADEPTDDDDLRLRKHVGVAAGLVIGIGALQLPLMAQGIAVSWAVALTMAPISLANVALLAATKRFERYVVLLILIVTVFPALVTVALGGMVGSSGGYVFAFVAPLFAVLALGRRRATGWLLLYLAVLLVLILLDPIISRIIPLQPYGLRLIFWASNLSAPLLITFFLLRYSERRRREAQARADELLTNAIPPSIATRLTHGEQRIAEAYPETTVLFADLAQFTPWARQTDPDRLVSALDLLFSRFDELAAQFGVEKIKTIGDAYMAVAGAPEPRSDHASAAVNLGLAMLRTIREAREPSLPPLELRIGLASGPVVGGVIGQRRLLFDLWGDTVNTAARMQSSGVPGRIQVASSTWEELRDGFDFEERTVEVKGIGAMRTYLLIAPQA